MGLLVSSVSSVLSARKVGIQVQEDERVPGKRERRNTYFRVNKRWLDRWVSALRVDLGRCPSQSGLARPLVQACMATAPHLGRVLTRGLLSPYDVRL